MQNTADNSHGLQAKGICSPHQHPTGIGDCVAWRLDRVEVVLGYLEVVVPSVAVRYATGDGGFGNVSAQLETESIQPVTD